MFSYMLPYIFCRVPLKYFCKDYNHVSAGTPVSKYIHSFFYLGCSHAFGGKKRRQN